METKKFTMINESFKCENCWKIVTKHPKWSARNHCLFCLYSKHVDKDYPGDRLSECHGLMKPVWIEYKKKKWNMIKYTCAKCWKSILNKIAPDDKFFDFVKHINKNK